MDGWDKMWSVFEKRYYAEPLLWFTELTTLIIALVTVSKQRVGVLFIIYIVCDFMLFNLDTYLQYFSDLSKKNVNRFIYQSNIIISLIEIAVYSYFFKNILTSENQKKFINPILITFCALSALFILSESFIHLNFTYAFLAYSTASVSFIFLILYSFLYYKQLLNSESSLNLLSRPSFWIVTGIFFYSFVSIPYYLLGTYLDKVRYEYLHLLDALLFFFPFTLNFLFLTKAFLCKKHLTK